MSEYVIDEGFDYFLEKFGQPDWQQPVDQPTLEYYRGKLPDRLLFGGVLKSMLASDIAIIDVKEHHIKHFEVIIELLRETTGLSNGSF